MRAHDDRVITGLEQRCGGREQRSGRAGHHQHVVGVQPGTAGRDRLAEHGITEVIAVAEEQLVELVEESRSPRSDRRRSATELSERLFVIVSYPSCSGDSTSMGIRR